MTVEQNSSWLEKALFVVNGNFSSSKPPESTELSITQDPEEVDKYLISYYLMGVSTLCVCCVGAMLNMLSLIVLTKRSVGSPTTNLYLISLAVADLLVLFATILTAIKDSRKPAKDQLFLLVWQDAQFIPRAYPYFHATAILFQVTSVWLTVAFTSDRYMMICHPFAAKRWCTVPLARGVIIAIYLASLFYGIPRYFEYTDFELVLPLGVILDADMSKSLVNFDEASVQSDNQSEQRVVWYDLSEFGRSEHFRSTYHLWSWNILVVGIPFITIAVMNSFLIREIRRSSSRGAKQNQRRESRRHETDIMLIGVIVIFFICQIPAAISHISWGVIPSKETQKIFWFLLNEIGNLLIVVNSAINLLPYYIFSRRFRRQFTQLFCPFRLVRDNGLHCIYIPRWVAENLAKDASDNLGATGAGPAGLPTTNLARPRQDSFVYGRSRHMSILPPRRPSMADGLHNGKQKGRDSNTRLERWMRSEQRAVQGSGRLSQYTDQSRVNSVPKLERTSLQATLMSPITLNPVPEKRKNTIVHINYCPATPSSKFDSTSCVR